MTGPVTGPAHIRRPVPNPATRTQDKCAPIHPHQRAHHASVRNFQSATRLDFTRAAANAAEQSSEAQEHVNDLRRGPEAQIPYAHHRTSNKGPPHVDWATFFAHGRSREQLDEEWQLADGVPPHWSEGGSSPSTQRQRELYTRHFDHENPDDCWGNKNNNNDTRPEYAFDYGSGAPGVGGTTTGSAEHSTDGKESAEESEEGSDQEYGGGGFTKEQWEEWKRSWGHHSRSHHSDWYYTHDSGAGAGSRQSFSQTNGASYSPISKEAAIEAGLRALHAAQRPVASEGEEAALASEIERHVADAAKWSGYNVVVFAAALGVSVEDTGDVERAERLAKRQLLLLFHPDKLQVAGGRGLLLGERVTQALNAMS